MRKSTLALATLALCSCAGLGSESWLISEQKEIQMGAEFHQQLLAQMPEYTADRRVTDYVQALGAAIVPVSDRPDLAYHFTVVQSDEINAFAVMGGYVYVTTGLLRASASGAEVATVLAHEVGHVAARHGVKAMETYLITQGLTDLLLQDGQTKDLVSGALQTVETLTFSKDQERQADELGVGYAADAAWNPWGMVDFFEYLQGAGGGGSGGGLLSGIGELFSTHPPTDERITSVSSQLGGLGIGRDTTGYRWGTVSDDAGFAGLKSALGN